MQKNVLNNGLTVCYFEKKGYMKKYAILATNYGSVDSIFTTNEGEFETPQGVAHFLEHKLFEQKDGTNALELFAKTGASPNAFTSQEMTAYYFECTDKFEENFKILLDYVSNPYFTDENVEKEQGIIGQEIRMVEDTPNWVCYVNMFEALYHNHPIKESIIGSIESISKITKETLYLCQKTFYNANNMVLCVAGDLDMDFVLKTAEEMYPKPEVTLISRDYKEEPSHVKMEIISKEMEVSQPLFRLGFKDNNADGTLDREVLGQIASNLFAGKTSELYEKLYNKGLINRSFHGNYQSFPAGGVLEFSGESSDPLLVSKIIKEELDNLNISDEELEITKNTFFGEIISAGDDFDSLCIIQVSAHFKGAKYDDFEKIYRKISKEDIYNFLSEIKENNALSIIKPKV